MHCKRMASIQRTSLPWDSAFRIWFVPADSVVSLEEEIFVVEVVVTIVGVVLATTLVVLFGVFAGGVVVTTVEELIAVVVVLPGGISTASATRQSTASGHCALSEPKGPTVLPSR